VDMSVPFCMKDMEHMHLIAFGVEGIILPPTIVGYWFLGFLYLVSIWITKKISVTDDAKNLLRAFESWKKTVNQYVCL
jgi:hypothetical protein